MAISTFTPGGNEVTTNDTTHVVAVASPGSGVQRIVSSVKVFNNDTVATNAVSVVINKNGTRRTVKRDLTPALGSTLEVRDIVLDATDESVEVVLDGAVTTNQSFVQAAFVDKA